jgi:hypothetical protein
MMSMPQAAQRKTFTVKQANAALPLVRAIVDDLCRLASEVAERRERLAMLTPHTGRAEDDPYQQELDQIEEELEDDAGRLRTYVEELLELGVEPKSATEGLVDFPAVVNGREVYLCWKLGEPDVRYWHDRDAGFAGRQLLTEGDLAG